MTYTTTINIHIPDITWYQRDAIFESGPRAIIEATTKAGKTIGCIWWLLTQCGNSPGERWWVAPVYDVARIAYQRTRDIVRQQCAAKCNDSKLTIEFGDRTIRFKSADDPDHLFGEDVKDAVIDEASRCKEEAWYAIRSTLTATNGNVRIIGNVNGRHNWAYRLARQVESGLSGWTYHKMTCYDAIDAGIISRENVEDARRTMPEHVFRELYEGVPSEDGSNPFGMQHIAACVGELGNGEPVAFGVDLARAVDWTVVVGLDGTGRVCTFDRWQRVPWRETVARIRSTVGAVPSLADSTGVGDAVVEELARESPNVEGFKFTLQSKQDLMEGLAVSVQSHAVTFPDGPIRLEMEQFEYAVGRSHVRYSAPDGLHDDCVMALALAVKKHGSAGEIGLAGTYGTKESTITDPRSWDEKRKDPDWGWEQVA